MHRGRVAYFQPPFPALPWLTPRVIVFGALAACGALTALRDLRGFAREPPVFSPGVDAIELAGQLAFALACAAASTRVRLAVVFAIGAVADVYVHRAWWLPVLLLHGLQAPFLWDMADVAGERSHEAQDANVASASAFVCAYAIAMAFPALVLEHWIAAVVPVAASAALLAMATARAKRRRAWLARVAAGQDALVVLQRLSPTSRAHANAVLVGTREAGRLGARAARGGAGLSRSEHRGGPRRREPRPAKSDGRRLGPQGARRAPPRPRLHRRRDRAVLRGDERPRSDARPPLDRTPSAHGCAARRSAGHPRRDRRARQGDLRPCARLLPFRVEPDPERRRPRAPRRCLHVPGQRMGPRPSRPRRPRVPRDHGAADAALPVRVLRRAGPALLHGDRARRPGWRRGLLDVHDPRKLREVRLLRAARLRPHDHAIEETRPDE